MRTSSHGTGSFKGRKAMTQSYLAEMSTKYKNDNHKDVPKGAIVALINRE